MDPSFQTLKFDYSELKGDVNSLFQVEEEEQISQGLAAVAALGEFVCIICDLVLLIFIDIPTSLICWDSDFLCARMSRLVRDVEAFFGQCLLAMGDIDGDYYVKDADFHRDGYNTFLTNKWERRIAENSSISTEVKNEELTGGKTKADDQDALELYQERLLAVQDFSSYNSIIEECYQSGDRSLLLKAVDKFVSLDDTNLKVDDFLISIACHYTLKQEFANALFMINHMTSAYNKIIALARLTDGNYNDDLFCQTLGDPNKFDERNTTFVQMALSIFSAIDGEIGVHKVRNAFLDIASDCLYSGACNQQMPIALNIIRRLEIDDIEVRTWFNEMLWTYCALKTSNSDELMDQVQAGEDIIKCYLMMLVNENFKKQPPNPKYNTAYHIEELVIGIVNGNLNNWCTSVRTAHSPMTLAKVLHPLEVQLQEECKNLQ